MIRWLTVLAFGLATTWCLADDGAMARLMAGSYSSRDLLDLREQFSDLDKAETARLLRLKGEADLAWRTDNPVQASRLAVEILGICPVFIEAHMLLDRIYRDSGAQEPADFHRGLATDLIKTITASGDGMSQETPFVIVAEWELNLALKLSLLSAREREILDENHQRVLLRVDVANLRTGGKDTRYFAVVEDL